MGQDSKAVGIGGSTTCRKISSLPKFWANRIAYFVAFLDAAEKSVGANILAIVILFDFAEISCGMRSNGNDGKMVPRLVGASFVFI